MKRPLFVFILMCIVGIAFAKISNDSMYILPSGLALIGFGIYICKKYAVRKGILLTMGIFYLVGFLLYFQNLNKKEDNTRNIEGKPVFVTANVVEKIVNYDETSYVMEIYEVIYEKEKQHNKGKILVSLKSKQELQYGNKVEFRGIIEKPSGKRNPGGIDYKLSLYSHDISATINVYENVKIIKKFEGNTVINSGLNLRDRIKVIIEKNFSKKRADLLKGMLIGDQSGLTEEDRESFRVSGLAHIMVVSGANIAYIMFPFYYVFKKFKVRKIISNPIIILILYTYITITGFEPSIVRAFIMALIVLIGQMFERDSDIYTTLAISAFIMLICNPFVLFNIGFQLSYIATLSIAMFYKKIEQKFEGITVPNIIKDTIAVTLSVQIGVTIILIYYFNKISIVSIFTNLVVVPITGIITITGFIMAVAGLLFSSLTGIFGYILSPMLEFILTVNKICTSIPYSTLQIVISNWIVVVFIYLLIVGLFILKKRLIYYVKRKIVLISLMCMVCIFTVRYIIDFKNPELTFLDVGSGDAIFFKSYAGKNILIDGGDKNDSIDKGKSVVSKFLVSKNIKNIDILIVTHAHSDHAGGIEYIEQNFNIKHLVLSEGEGSIKYKKLLDIAREKKIKTDIVLAGNNIEIDKKTKIEVLNPYDGQKNNVAYNNKEVENSDENNKSVVLKIVYENTKILLCGDIEKELEQQLVNGNIDLKANILKVAHHGSNTSTTDMFLKKINPEIAVISVGKNNFGHPSNAVISRLEENGTKIFRTDKDGAVTIRFGENGLSTKKMIY